MGACGWTNAANSGTKASPQAKQGGYINVRPTQQRPNFYGWQPILVQRSPARRFPVQRFPVQRSPIWRLPVPAPTTAPRSSNNDIGSLFMMIYALRLITPITEATTTTTTTTPPPTIPTTTTTTTTTAATTTTQCPWETWGACSAACKGTRTKKRTCSAETETEDCNTQTGFEPTTGWYRAANCYDYAVGLDEVSYDTAKTTCASQTPTARLAYAGMKDNAVRNEVMVALFDPNLDTVFAFVDAKRVSTSDPFLWEDTTTVNPTIFSVGEPDATYLCVVLVIGNPQSGHDANCNGPHNYICEREAA